VNLQHSNIFQACPPPNRPACLPACLSLLTLGASSRVSRVLFGACCSAWRRCLDWTQMRLPPEVNRAVYVRYVGGACVFCLVRSV